LSSSHTGGGVGLQSIFVPSHTTARFRTLPFALSVIVNEIFNETLPFAGIFIRLLYSAIFPSLERIQSVEGTSFNPPFEASKN